MKRGDMERPIAFALELVVVEVGALPGHNLGGRIGEIADPVRVWSKYSNAQRVSSLHLSKGRLNPPSRQGESPAVPSQRPVPQSERKVRSRERLGRLLRFYHREAA